MAQTRDTVNQQTSVKAGPSQPLIALPTEDGGTLFFTSRDAANAVRTDATLQRALAQAGAWRDLADEDVEGELDRLRHEVPPSPPLSL